MPMAPQNSSKRNNKQQHMVSLTSPPPNGKDDDGSSTNNSLPDKDDNSSSYDGGGSSQSLGNSSTGSSGNSNRTDLQQELAKNESRHVCWLRGVVIGVLTVAAVLVSFAMYYSIKRSELETFEVQFADHAASMMNAFETHIKEGIASLDHLGVSLVVGGEDGSASADWPFITVSDWHIRAASTRSLGLFESLSLVPVVDNATRAAYEEYTLQNTQQNTQWIAVGMAYEQETDQDEWDFGNNQDDGRMLQQGNDDFAPPLDSPTRTEEGVATQVYQFDKDGNAVVSDAADPENDVLYAIWQHAPVTPSFVNFNLASHPQFGPEMQIALETRKLVLGQPVTSGGVLQGTGFATDESADETNVPSSIFSFPITSTEGDVVTPLGSIVASIYWDAYLQVAELPDTANDIQLVLDNACGSIFTFTVRNEVVRYLGKGDLHETNDYTDDLTVEYSMVDDFFPTHPLLTFAPNIESVHAEYCPYALHVYPTRAMQSRYETNQPAIFTALVAIVFCFTTLVFVGYDYYVERRQKIIMTTAVKSHAIVSSLFPKTVRERLFGDADMGGAPMSNHELKDGMAGAGQMMLTTQKAKLKNFMKEGRGGASSNLSNTNASNTGAGATNTADVIVEPGDGNYLKKSKPIADLFPHTTVLFADIAGFTAWSSTREPSQVFTLLETLYGAFDRIAEKRRVFKVETIGDCYVAATGLPDPQPDHALVMVKFAGDILQKMERVTRELEVELGPDTGDLSLRIGLHSGPVTAGVLRGQKSRFQLFGDTVNTASRMESNGRPNHIQCSQATADLLTESKPNWVVPRQDKIHAKGKGLIQTYWVFARGRTIVSGSATASVTGSIDDMTLDDMSNDGSHASLGSNGLGNVGITIPDNLYLEPKRSANFERLVDWNVDLLLRLLKGVVARQHCMKERKNHGIVRAINPVHLAASAANATVNMAASTVHAAAGIIKPHSSHGAAGDYLAQQQKEFDLNNPRDEYAECIHLPRFDKNTTVAQVTADDITLKTHIEDQLRDYVTKVACSYHDNPFHSYDHASHVTMSANKILKRIVEAADCEVQPSSLAGVAETLHEYSYGITSDPLTHFACVFSAMIHDVDHPGVSNGQLVNECDDMAALYENKSVAEQNSVDLAWGLLMDTAYADLRRVLFANDSEKKRFRQLLVNSVMATDIFDPELKAMRNKRWEKAFFETHEDLQEGSDLKATIVIEHIIQAADVSHTMQHWHVYQKWNRRLFNEMYRAYKSGRLEKDPSEGWYKGELWFYDNYIIPLAKKLKDCGVFGVSSDEFLNYAMMNRSEWESKGESIVAELLQRAEEKFEKKPRLSSNDLQTATDKSGDSVDGSLGSLTAAD